MSAIGRVLAFDAFRTIALPEVLRNDVPRDQVFEEQPKLVTNIATVSHCRKTKGLLWSEQPFANQVLEMVAGVRFELTTFGL